MYRRGSENKPGHQEKLYSADKIKEHKELIQRYADTVEKMMGEEDEYTKYIKKLLHSNRITPPKFFSFLKDIQREIRRRKGQKAKDADEIAKIRATVEQEQRIEKQKKEMEELKRKQREFQEGAVAHEQAQPREAYANDDEEESQ